LYTVEQLKPRSKPGAGTRGVGRGNWRGKKTQNGGKSKNDEMDDEFDEDEKKKPKRSRPSIQGSKPSLYKRSEEALDDDFEEYKPKPRQRGEPGEQSMGAMPIGGLVRKRGTRGRGTGRAARSASLKVEEDNEEDDPPKKVMKADDIGGANDDGDIDIAALKRKILKGNTLSPDGKADNTDMAEDDDDVDPYSAPTAYL
jgi:hypothetical protein